MGIQDRGMQILESEISTITMSMKRGNLWSNTRGPQDSATESLLQAFLELKRILQESTDFATLDPQTFLSPFLDVIRSEVVTGPVTGLALSSVNKFIAYGLLNEAQINIANAVKNLAEAVTHARYRLEIFSLKINLLSLIFRKISESTYFHLILLFTHFFIFTK